MAAVTSKNIPNGQVPTTNLKASGMDAVATKKPITISAFSKDVNMGNTEGYNGDDGDDGTGGDYESDAEEITLEEKQEYERTQAKGAKNAGVDSKMEQIPAYVLEYYKAIYPTFLKFWTTKAPFSKQASKHNKAIKNLINEHGDDSAKTVGVLSFDTFERAKDDALKQFEDSDIMDRTALLRAWSSADKTITGLREDLNFSGFPEEFGPPVDWIEQITGLQRSGDDETDESDNSSIDSENDTEKTSVSDEQWDPDADDSIEGLSRACGAKLPLLSADGEVCGYSRMGGRWEILVKQGRDTNVRYRLVPAKAAVNFDPSNPNGQNLAAGQRGPKRDPETGTRKWQTKHVKALKAVAWLQDEEDEDPISAMRYTGEGRQSFPVTRVKILWSDDEETWETRTTLRALYPRETADAMIYQRAGIQEARYRRGQGLSDLAFKRVKLPGSAPSFSISTSSRASGRSSRKSRSVAASRVAFNDDSEDESVSGAFSKEQKAELQQMVQGLTQMVISALSIKGR